MGTASSRGRAPLGPLLAVSGASVLICASVLAWRFAAAGVSLLGPVLANWKALAARGALLAAAAELVSGGKASGDCCKSAGLERGSGQVPLRRGGVRRNPSTRCVRARDDQRPSRTAQPNPPPPPRPRPQAFYLLYWRPARAAWNRQPCSPHAPARLDAMDNFRRFLASSAADGGQTKLDAYLSIWFQGTAWDQIRRGNMEELMAYGAPRGRGRLATNSRCSPDCAMRLRIRGSSTGRLLSSSGGRRSSSSTSTRS